MASSSLKNTSFDKALLADSSHPDIQSQTIKDLKLRIIHGPLQATTKSTICCLCCKDTVGGLLSEERVLVLSCGYIRQCYNNDIPPVIIDLCVSYVGSSKDFNSKLLRSFAEERKMPRVRCLEGCQDCWTDCCKEFCSCEMILGDCCCDCWIHMMHTSVTKCCNCWTILQYCTLYECCFGFFGDIMVAILFLISIGITFGKDITALVINYHNNCNIPGGSDYIPLINVHDWILIGSISSSSLWIIIICFVIVFIICEKSGRGFCDNISCIWVVCTGCVWALFIPWIVFGFLFYSEMNAESPISPQCKDIVLSWSILQLIPTIITICAVSAVVASEGVCGDVSESCIEYCVDCYTDGGESCDNCCGRCGTWMLHGCLAWVLLAFFFGKDIAAVIVNSNYNCDVMGRSKYVSFDVTEWIYIASIYDIGFGIVFFCWFAWGNALTIESHWYIIPGLLFFSCGFAFNIAWIVIGFLLYGEMSSGFDSRSNKECGDVILSWNVLQATLTLCLVTLLCALKRNL